MWGLIMHRTIIFLLLTSLFLAFSGATLMAQEQEHKLKDGLYAKIETEKGDILLELFYKAAPLTVINFAGLAEGTLNLGGADKPTGVPFYDGLKFHRVIKQFMIQGGDPLGNGTGGPGYTFPDEIVPTLRHDRPGILSMANAGPNTNGSQFFITHVATPHLDGKHTVFGHVVKGQDVVNDIEQGDIIKKIEIIRVGKEAEEFKTDQAAFDKILEGRRAKAEAAAREHQEKINAIIEKKWPDTIKTASGLRYHVLKEGSGQPPKPGTTVLANYVGRLLETSRQFDSSYDRGEPIRFQVGTGQVIPAWDEALLTMKKGEKRVLIVPPELAYGKRGVPQVIPPNSWLEFEVEIVNF